MKIKFKIFITISLVLVLFLGISYPVFGQCPEPDGTFSIANIESYRHVLELNDTLFLITGTVEYSTTPTYPINQTYIARLMLGAVEIATATFYPYHDNGYDYGVCSIYFDAADVASIPITWGGGYHISLEGNPTVEWLDITATTAWDAALFDDGGAFTDETTDINDADANDVTLMAAVPAADDAFYFGSSGMFDYIRFNLGTQGNWTGTYTYEYWDGDEWMAVSGLSDGTAGFTSAAGVYDITFTCPDDWQTTAVNGLDYYWARFRIVTYSAIVANPLGTQAWSNTLAAPPSTSNNVINWIDEGSVSAAKSRLTTRLRGLAQIIENDWGGTTDLVETIAGEKKLTDEGEEYFTESIDNLRLMCPDLFTDVITTPEFEDMPVVQDNYMGGHDHDYDVYGANLVYAQTFTASANYAINGFEAKLFRVGAPGNITGAVYDTIAGVPDTLLASGILDDDEVTTATTGGWYVISFTADEDLTEGTVYALVLSVPGGGVADYISWFDDSTGAYAGGQSYLWNGAAWGPLAGHDFMFGTTGTDVQTMSYRNRLASQLVGTRFDMTQLGLVVFGGLSRMGTSTIVWIIFACIIPSIFVVRAVNSFKPVSFVFALMLPFGALLGFIYLEVAVIAAFLFAGMGIFSVFYKPSST